MASQTLIADKSPGDLLKMLIQCQVGPKSLTGSQVMDANASDPLLTLLVAAGSDQIISKCPSDSNIP